MTGRRLLISILSWDYSDYRPKRKKKPQNTTTKRWSKKVRLLLKKDFKEQLKELEND